MGYYSEGIQPSETLNPKKNWIKEAIRNNDPIEDKLHVIAVLTNPCHYERRCTLMQEFQKRFKNEEADVLLYIVEVVYGDEQFTCTDALNPKHLQLRAGHTLWLKENMINLGVQTLLPPDWKAFAWIDSDLEFESLTWAMDTLKLLNGAFDIVQLFSHCVDMNAQGEAMTNFSSFGYNYTKLKRYCGSGPNYYHSGFAWAMTRKLFEKLGGLYENAILGSGDYVIASCTIDRAHKCIPLCSDGYTTNALEYQEKMKYARLGYVPGVIRHHFHGSKKNRKYRERNQILIEHEYDPTVHLTKDSNGLIQLISQKARLQRDILEYFKERKEDDTENAL